jgi:hypothetical protein
LQELFGISELYDWMFFDMSSVTVVAWGASFVNYDIFNIKNVTSTVTITFGFLRAAAYWYHIVLLL